MKIAKQGNTFTEEPNEPKIQSNLDVNLCKIKLPSHNMKLWSGSKIASNAGKNRFES